MFAQEDVINDIIDIFYEYRKWNKDKDVRNIMEKIEFIEDTFQVQEQVQNYLEKTKYDESSLTSTQSQGIFNKNNWKLNKMQKNWRKNLVNVKKSIKQSQQRCRRI